MQKKNFPDKENGGNEALTSAKITFFLYWKPSSCATTTTTSIVHIKAPPLTLTVHYSHTHSKIDEVVHPARLMTRRKERR